MNAGVPLTRHISTDAPQVLVVDGSRVVRQLIERVLKAELPHAVVIGCGSGAEALAALEGRVIDFVSTALRLPDMDGIQLAQRIRESASQAYIPIVVVSGDVQERLVSRTLSREVTDYFDKSLGFEALAAFIRGYVHPTDEVAGKILYVEDSRVVAVATRRMLEKSGFDVVHVLSGEAALEYLESALMEGRGAGVDLVLTDISLKGEMSGGDLLRCVREDFGYGKGDLPVLVMTGDDDPTRQSVLLREGANDLVHKPIEERLLITKLKFQLRVARARAEESQESA